MTAAAKKHVDILIVHHGLFWPGLQSVTGALRRQLKIAFENDIALYSVHLPLDVHPKVGNTALLATALGLKSAKRFLKEKGTPVGLKAKTTMTRSVLIRRLRRVLRGPVKTFNFGPAQLRRVGIVTGAAGSEIYRVAEANIDTFLPGEAPHWAAVAAEELGMNLILGGHYATETFGVKALAAHLSDRFKLSWEFLNFPTGL
jgi:dinuclear metal center YbgI/SA1388 family protein